MKPPPFTVRKVRDAFEARVADHVNAGELVPPIIQPIVFEFETKRAPQRRNLEVVDGDTDEGLSPHST